MKTTHSKVMTIANRLVKNGYNRANAMIKAWALAKMPLVETKVSVAPIKKYAECTHPI